MSCGRALIANPDLVERLRAGLPLTQHDPAVRYMDGDDGYVSFGPSGAVA